MRGLIRTDGGDKVDDDEGVQDWDDRRGDGIHDVAQAFEAPEEAQDSEGPQHLESKKGGGENGHAPTLVGGEAMALI